MTNRRKEFESQMKQIMEYIVIKGEIPELDDFGKECLHQCCESGFLTGVETDRALSGDIIIGIMAPKVLKSGLEFCYPKTSFETKVNVVLIITTIASTVIAIIQTLRLS
ncbi:hypothetical protein SDC9_141736 [bioreactor metagenome]|uniref:Uncharacterized protein n=1 Tax=bioreactor metagenome TaxID=1076179 RepID=A0A645DYI6_9ZZZZ